MASQFDRWEKDPFFPAAEEVQESADRMESTYRTWIHSMKDTAGMWNPEELRRDLRTALGTTKWQLDEFERAVNSSYTNSGADDSKDRHRNFSVAIGSQISKVETSLKETAVSQGKQPSSPWVRLDEGESDELALFLSGPSMFSSRDRNLGRQNGREEGEPRCQMNTSHSMDWSQVEAEERLPGHRRIASAGADMCSWKIAVAEDALPHSSTDGQGVPPPRKTPSFSGFLNKMEAAAKLKWPKNGYRKLKLSDRHADSGAPLPRTQPLTRGTNLCYERSKSCLEGCDNCYDKQLNGWCGTIKRQLYWCFVQVRKQIHPLSVITAVYGVAEYVILAW